MAKVNPKFEFDMFRFVHRPLRMEDTKNDNFLEKYMLGMQNVWEQINGKVFDLSGINNPSTCSPDVLQYLKDIVGFTKELDYITRNLSETDLRKVILLGVPLWKTKGLELGFRTIIKLFTGFDARVFTWFDYRMIVGEKAIGEEQLGEDAWLISLPGVEYKETLGDVFLLLQFDKKTLKDGSRYQNSLRTYGSFFYEEGGPIGQSSFYPVGSDWCIKSTSRPHFTFAKGMTFECFFKTDTPQTFPLISHLDESGKGIELVLNTVDKKFIFTISDGIITETREWAVVADLADNNWHHVAWVFDWLRFVDPLNDDITAMWVDGVRIGREILSEFFTPHEVRSLDDIKIGSKTECGARYRGAFDIIRLAGDPRYSVDLETITLPATRYVEYQREELDEFQIDVRVVDDGTLDRLQLKRIINLMRPVGERMNINYIDFYDAFESGKGKLETISGNSYVEVTDYITYLKLQPDSLEHINVTGCKDWTNYIAQFRADIYSGKEFEIRWLVQDENNYYAFRVNAETKLATLDACVAGVRSSISAPVVIDIEIAKPSLYYSFYIFTVSCYRDQENGNTTIRAFLDSNKLFEVDDHNFKKGTLGLYCPVGSVCWCSEIEMFQHPLDRERINPNDKF